MDTQEWIKQQTILSGRRVALLSLGCKVNAYETEGMRELFLQAGAEVVDFEDTADVYLVNTCSVTNIADRKSRQMLHRAKKQNPQALVVAAGCYAQAAGEKLALDESVDLVVGNNKKAEIVALVAQNLSEKTEKSRTFVMDISKERNYEELPIALLTEHTRAFIKVQDGCNQFCSYCIIPYVRGRVRSRKEEDVLAEVKRLAAEGYREIVLTGIHLSSYGLEKKTETEPSSEFDATLAAKETILPLLRLIRLVHEVDGIERIRLGSLEPRIMTEDFVRELAKLKKVCPHFHLSLQSGCDATLKRMNRKYTTAEYRTAVENLRRYLEYPAITTDIIVGFPGETEEEFAETLAFAEEIGFSQIHIFKYSNRKGTVADRLPNQVPEPVKTGRSDRLFLLEQELENRYRSTFFGKEEEILTEEETECKGKRYMLGHTTRYVKLALLTDGSVLPNENIKVSVTDERYRDAYVAKVCE